MQHDDRPPADLRSRSTGRRCAHCGGPVLADRGESALVPDSSVVDVDDPTRDGRRLVTACGSGHLQLLIDKARHDWRAGQLWFGRLCRASTQPRMSEAPLWLLGERAHLSIEDLQCALEWNADGDSPRTALPGGQPLPVREPRADRGSGDTGHQDGAESASVGSTATTSSRCRLGVAGTGDP